MDSDIEARTRALWEEAFNARDLDALDAITAPEFVNHNALPGTPRGPEGHRQVVERLWKAFPDARFQIEHLAGDGRTVICVGRMSGTHAGTLLGVPATGRKVEWRQCHLYRFDESGRAVEHDAIRDDVGLRRQFGERDENRNKDIDYAAPLSDEQIAARKHRTRVGRKWAVMGPLQRDFLVAQGLRPQHRLLDVGCGPLRAGIHFVEYLDPAHYYGIDINETLLDAGFTRELPEQLRDKLPRDHLRATDRFDCDFGVRFDYALANSVFTHVSLNHVRLCLYRVGRVLAPEGRFYASYFQAPIGHPLDASCNDGRRWTERNAFFYYRSDLAWAARWADLDVRFLGGWGHPGGQQMAEFRHTRRRVRTRALAEQAGRRLSPALKRAVKRALGGRV